ncbi:MAG TPA: site-2 protease family protein [Bryobacteraceae bacterium]|nr:site-2 protease family protein [Bryobacteraceae bacterium]
MTIFLSLVVAVYIHFSLHFLNRAADAAGFPKPSFVALQGLLAIAILALVTSHEAGHWIAGRAVGWRCLRLRMGPLALVRSGHGWKLRWTRWEVAGAVAFSPSGLEGYRKADAIFTAGGPLASIVFPLLCAGIAWQARSAAMFWLFGTLAQWSVMGALSLVPMGKGLLRSDGYWLWGLMRGGYEADRRLRYMLVNMSHGTPLRPRDWPWEAMRPVIDAGSSCRDRHECYLAYKYLLDSGQTEAALPWLARLLEKWRKADPPEYALEAAFYLSVHAPDPDLAAKWLAAAGKDTEPWVRLRAQSAVAWASGRQDEARHLADRALAQLRRAAPCGAVEYEKARLDGVEAARRQASPPEVSCLPVGAGL